MPDSASITRTCLGMYCVLYSEVRAAPYGKLPDDLAGRRALGLQRLADDQVQLAVVTDDLVRVFRSLVGAHHLAGGGVQGGDRLAVAERDVHAIAHGHQAPGQFGRSAAEGSQLVLPGRDRFLPEQHAVERVAGDQHPLRVGPSPRRSGPSSTMENIRPAADTTALTLER